MLERLRRFWPALLVILVVAGVLAFNPGLSQPPAYAQAPQPTPEASSNSLRTISVSGNGSADVTPDMATVSLGVQTDAQTASQAITANNTQMQAVISALQKAGVASADIQTTSVQLSPRYEPPTSPEPQQAQPTPANHIVGYTASNTVTVKVRKLDSLGGLLDDVVQAGGNQIQGISFGVADPAQAMDQAREAAMKDATHKAQQLAGLANEKLGPVFSINETSQAPIPFAAAMVQSAAANQVPVAPGTQTITVNLQVTWIIQQ